MSRGVSMRVAALILIWLAALAAVIVLPYLLGSPKLGDDLTRRTVWVALVFYGAAGWRMLGLRPSDWRAETDRGRLARWCWTLGLAAFVVHVGMAFHFFHHWSHAQAVERVHEQSGVGEGVFASYLFTAAWTADVAWWWLSPPTYAGRSPWTDRLLHGFMMFMVVMATVVYEDGPVRWFGLTLTAALALRVLLTRPGAPWARR